MATYIYNFILKTFEQVFIFPFKNLYTKYKKKKSRGHKKISSDILIQNKLYETGF